MRNIVTPGPAVMVGPSSGGGMNCVRPLGSRCDTIRAAGDPTGKGEDRYRGDPGRADPTLMDLEDPPKVAVGSEQRPNAKAPRSTW